jgi:Cu2+-exporting ATPase
MPFPIIYFLPAAAVSVGSILCKQTKKMVTAYAAKKTEGRYRHQGDLDLKKKTISQMGSKDNLQPIQDVYADKMKEYRRSDGKTINRAIIITLISMGCAVYAASYPFLGLFSSIGILYATRPVFMQAIKMLKSGRVGVDMLSAFAISGCIISGYLLVANLVNLIFFFSLKLYIKVASDSKGKLTDVFTQIPNFVWMRIGETEVQVPFQDVREGDMLIVNAGETIPVDGIINEGMASVDQHILTGEAAPAEKTVGEKVFALTTVLSGRIEVKVEQAGKQTAVSKIADILDQTLDFQSTTELRVLYLADRTVPPTLIMSGAALIFSGPYMAISVVAAHFKYNFILVSPISLMNFLKIASDNGVLIKDGRSLDLLPQVDTIVFDKTGTLTKEKPVVGTIRCCRNYNEDDVLIYTAAAESKQTHPIAMAIIKEAEDRNLHIPNFDSSDYHAGYGINVRIAGKSVHVGSARFIKISGISLPQNIIEMQEACHNKGHSLVITAVNQEVAGAIELIPALRPEALEIIRSLRNLNQIKDMYIISGDHETPTRVLAQHLGIKHYFSEILPEKKAKIIKSLREEGKFVCYVGDGINDTIAMKYSNLSVSMRGASRIATDTARIVLMTGGLRLLPFIFDLAQDFQKNSNLMFALIGSPTVIGIGGAFLFGTGIIGTTLLCMVGLLAAAGVAVMPLFSYSKKSLISEKDQQEHDCDVSN